MLAALLLALVTSQASQAFVLSSRPARRPDSTVLRMGFMDGFKKAFENDPAYAGKASSPGLSSTKAKVDVTICGKKTQAIPGQRMKDLVRASRAPIKFNCENGQCGTCEALVNGRKVRVCMYSVPSKGPVEVKRK